MNDVLGMKLAPRPSESATSVPVCVPDFEPMTTIGPRPEAGTPRNVICACGTLYALPGIGNTLTVLAANASPGSTAHVAAATTIAAIRRMTCRSGRLSTWQTGG